MPYFTGDTIRIETVSNDFNGDPLVDDDAVVTLDILAAATDVIVGEDVAMAWSETDGAYVYDWETADVEPGAYRLATKVVGSDGTSVEVRSIYLADPDPAP